MNTSDNPEPHVARAQGLAGPLVHGRSPRLVGVENQRVPKVPKGTCSSDHGPVLEGIHILICPPKTGDTRALDLPARQSPLASVLGPRWRTVRLEPQVDTRLDLRAS